jgi:hypothetical protein
LQEIAISFTHETSCEGRLPSMAAALPVFQKYGRSERSLVDREHVAFPLAEKLEALKRAEPTRCGLVLKASLPRAPSLPLR